MTKVVQRFIVTPQIFPSEYLKPGGRDDSQMGVWLLNCEKIELLKFSSSSNPQLDTLLTTVWNGVASFYQRPLLNIIHELLIANC